MFDFLKREDGSWNIGLIMALVVACLSLLGGGYIIYTKLLILRESDYHRGG